MDRRTEPLPTQELFDDVVEQLARDPRTAEHSPDWIRQTIVLGGEKVRIMRYIRRASPNGGGLRLLDVGAQIGAFALFAARTGCKVSAVDYGIFPKIYSKIMAEQGVDYRTCDLGSEPLPFSDSSFDVVTYTDVIEHHSFSPKKVLREIYRVLVPGGLCLLSTPNHASIYNRVLLLFGKSVNDNFVQYFEHSAEQPTYLGHHREYTRAELRCALERTGFKVRECRAVEEDLASFIHYRRRMGRKQLRPDARTFVVRTLGSIWAPLHLPFGRLLWAVGQKPSSESSAALRPL